MQRSFAMRCLRVVGQALACLLALVSLLPAATAQEIRRASSSILYFEESSTTFRASYAAFEVQNTTASVIEDAWAQIDSFGAGTTVNLAPFEDGLYPLGRLAPGERATAFFYLRVTAPTQGAAQAVAPRVRVFDSKPPEANALASATFPMTVEDGIRAQANQVTSVVYTPDDPTVAADVIIEVRGSTGTIGSSRLLSFTPASDIFWRADVFELIETSITFDIAPAGPSASDRTFVDLLNPFLGSDYSANTPYVATYSFRAIGATDIPTAVTPIAFIMSGTQIKYTSTDTSTYQSLPPIPPIENLVRIDKSVAPTSLPLAGGTSLWTVTVENHSAFSVRLDEFRDTLPDGFRLAQYEAGSASFDGNPVTPIEVAPGVLRFTGAFVVPACWDTNRSGTCDIATEDTTGDGRCTRADCSGPALAHLRYRLLIPPGEAAHENHVVAAIGPTRIDTTFDVTDLAPARAGLTVGSVCGDGLIEGAETCDDGNLTNGDGCSSACRVETGYICAGAPSVCATLCGDGVVAASEACDDGNNVGGDGCSSTCTVEPGFGCEGSPSICTVRCGDALIRGGETCDDDNTLPGDGCSDRCEIEPGWTCDGEPSVCSPICGDGRLLGGESCDDGNAVSGDGCSASCGIEPGWTCDGAPSTCTPIDVCADGDDTCDDNATCTTTGPGTFACACNTGYRGDGVTCTPIDVCADGDDTCDDNATCTTTGPGTFACACNTGYRGDGVTCTPIDVCADGDDTCDRDVESCVASGPGTFTCECRFPDEGLACGEVQIAIASPENDEVVRTPRPTLRGTGSPGAVVEVWLDGELVGTVLVADDGTWSFPMPRPLAAGPYDVDVIASRAGREADASVSFTVEIFPPYVTIESPADGDRSTESPTRISGRADPGELVEVLVDGVFIGDVIADADGTWSVPVNNELPPGTYVVEAFVRNDNGVGRADATFEVIDPTQLVILAPTEGSVVRTATPTISGTAPPGATVTLLVDGVVVGETTADAEGRWTHRLAGALAEGEVTVVASTEDPSGPLEDTVTFFVDLGRGVRIESPTEGALTNDPTPSIAGSSEPFAEVVLFIDGVEAGRTTADENGRWRFDDPRPVDDGEHEYSVTATTPDGEVSEDAVRIIVDTRPPVLFVDEPLEGERDDPVDVVSGRGEPGARVRVWIDGELVGETTVDEDGTWSVPLDDPLGPGSWTVVVESEDGAGNRNREERDVIVRDTAPVEPEPVEPDEDVGVPAEPTPDASVDAGPDTAPDATADVEDEPSSPSRGRLVMSGGGPTCAASHGSGDTFAWLVLAGALLVTRRRRQQR